MTDAIPQRRLTLVQEALAADPPPDAARKGVETALSRYAPSIAKRVRAQVTSELLTKLGAQTIEEASQLATIRAERDARPTATEEHKHVKAAFWKGAALFGISAFAAGVVGACALLAFVVVPFNAQTRASTEAGVMMGVASQQQTDRPVGAPNYERTRREPADAQP